MSATMRRPTLLDRLDLLLLRAAKRRRPAFEGEDVYYEQFFTEDDLAKYAGDVRNLWRLEVVRGVFVARFPDGEAQVVDVGCGLGFTQLALPTRAGFLGIDVSARTLEAARRLHGARGATFRVGGFPTLPVADGQGDFVVCLEVLEHVADDAAAARELRRITRTGGYVLVSVPGTFFWPDYERLIGHHRHYTAASLEQLLAAAGFEVVERIDAHAALWRGYYYAGYLPLKLAELAVRHVRPGFSIFATSPYRAVARATVRRLTRSRLDAPYSTFVLCRALESRR